MCERGGGYMGLGKKKVHYRQVADALRVPLVIDQRLDESMRCDRRVREKHGALDQIGEHLKNRIEF